MLSAFQTTAIAHAAGPNRSGNASETVITTEALANARQEITAWQGYVPTPLVSLKGLASKLSVETVFYKHEGPRFGLGSFKALDGACAQSCRGGAGSLSLPDRKRQTRQSNRRFY